MPFICKICDRSFNSKRGLDGHMRMHGPSGGKNPPSTATKQKLKKQTENTIRQYNMNTKHCIHCSTPIDYDHRMNKYCSSSCAATVTNTNRGALSKGDKKSDNCKICNDVISVSKYAQWGNTTCPACVSAKKSFSEYPFCKLYLCNCSHCDTKFCSRTVRKYCAKHNDLYKSNNRNRYTFKFNVYHYPELFDLDMITELGWHSYGGRFDYNPEGLTRDHRVSVNEAIKYDYDPYYIKHPINCEIMSFKQNNIKKTRSSVSYDVLKKEVDEFDQK